MFLRSLLLLTTRRAITHSLCPTIARVNQFVIRHPTVIYHLIPPPLCIYISIHGQCMDAPLTQCEELRIVLQEEKVPHALFSSFLSTVPFVFGAAA